jgi:hypothetical protein
MLSRGKPLIHIKDERLCAFLLIEQDGFCWVLQRGQDVLRYFVNQLAAPERVGHVVVDDSNVFHIEGNIILVRGHEGNWLLDRVGQSKLIEY